MSIALATLHPYALVAIGAVFGAVVVLGILAPFLPRVPLAGVRARAIETERTS